MLLLAGSRRPTPAGPPAHLTPLAGDLGNTLAPSLTETEKAALSLVGPQAPAGEGDRQERGPTLLGHGQPRPRKENSFSGHICSCVAPPRLQIKTPETPAAPASGQREAAGRSPARNQHQTTEQPFRSTATLPALTSKPRGIKTWGRAFRGPPVSAGVARAWLAQAVLTVGAVDAGVLVVAEEEATVALTLVAAHGIDADLLAAAIVVLTLVHVCKRRGEERSHRSRTRGRHQLRSPWAVTMPSRGWPAPFSASYLCSLF